MARKVRPRAARSKAVVSAGDLLPSALKDLGVASGKVTRRIAEAWGRAADPSWGDRAVPSRLVGGVLVVEVSSSSLRDELAQFHRDRLLDVLRASVADVPLVGLRFVSAGATPEGGA